MAELSEVSRLGQVLFDPLREEIIEEVPFVEEEIVEPVVIEAPAPPAEEEILVEEEIMEEPMVEVEAAVRRP